jgi:AcrR family transcriptional regulator
VSETAAVGLEPAGEALLALSLEKSWREIGLRDIAERAGLDLADLYAQVPGKEAVLARLSRTLDAAALKTARAPDQEAHDRLFDAAMARLEAMEPHREALTRLAREVPPLVLAAHFPFTARAILEGAGVAASPPRLAAMILVWARTAQVWRDDEGALNRTMAELDKRLRQMAEAFAAAQRFRLPGRPNPD